MRLYEVIDDQFTPAFRAWFGQSHVVDADGRPLKVYHGTPTAGFDSFADEHKGRRTQHAPEDVGYHFTDDPEFADAYSGSYVIRSHDLFTQKFGREPKGLDLPKSPAIYPVYLSMQKPLHLRYSKEINAQTIEQAQQSGHDGIIADHGTGTEYVVFRPSQIKSAVSNRGSYASASDNIIENVIVYHGSPHLFSPEDTHPHGRFRLDKLGSGEGAQVYGKGLYFAENPKVSQTYKNRLTNPKQYSVPMFLDDQPVTSRNWVSIEREMYQKGDKIGGIIASILGDANRYNLRNMRQIRDFYKPDARGFNKNMPFIPAKEWAEVLRQFGRRVRMAPSRGVVYTVELQADQDRDFLDWNKPISDQPWLQPLVAEYWQPGMYVEPSTWTTRYLHEPMYGGDLYQSLMLHGGHDGAAEIMLKAGLKGSKYLDKGSRPNGQGGYNYVVMDPSIIEIRDKRIARG